MFLHSKSIVLQITGELLRRIRWINRSVVDLSVEDPSHQETMQPNQHRHTMHKQPEIILPSIPWSRSNPMSASGAIDDGHMVVPADR